MSAIPTLDFGSLGLEFMLEESERHSEMIFNRETLEEMNKPSHIGGCLPIWGIIYLDFVDFDAIPLHQSTVDYSLPRISHIKNEDFQYLALVDRNYQSSKAFGVLPLRHISQTLYATAVPLGNASDEPDFSHPVVETEADNNNEVPFLNSAINLNSQQSNTAEPKITPKDEVDVKVKTDSQVKSEIPFKQEVNKQEPVEPKAENLTEAETKVEDNTVVETPNIAINPANLNRIPVPSGTTSQPKVEVNSTLEPRSYVMISSTPQPDRRKDFRASPIIIEDESPFTPGPAGGSQNTQPPNDDPNVGIHIAMSFADTPGAGTSTGPNTIDKKNRKKRAAKTQSPDAPKKLKISRDVDLFFTNFLRKPIYKERTIFVDVDGFPVSYENFYNSFKARADIGDEVMNCLIQTINLDSKTSSQIKPFIKKFCFTSYFTDKLLVQPEVFDPISCQREFERINSEESLWKDDLLFFPTIKNTHWVLCCINSLFEKTHFFDPCGTTQDNAQQEIIHNLVSNFNLLAKLSKNPFKNVFTFKLQTTGPYPTNCLMHDSGHYIPLYLDNFEGKIMKSFTAENVPK